MESIKIIALCIAAGILYGIAHDQITARICLEYFTVFHPPVFRTESPTLLGIGWGIIATWWVGAFLGLLLAVSSRFGSQPKVHAADLAPRIAALLCLMAACALLSGFGGFAWARGQTPPVSWIRPSSSCSYARFMADAWAHSASYLSGFVGGLWICAHTIWQRMHALPSPRRIG